MGFYNKKRNRGKKHVEDNYVPPFSQEELSKGLDILRLNPKTLELLTGANITTIGQLVKRSEKDLYKIKTFNKKNLFDVKNGLSKNKLFLKPMEEKTDKEPQEKPQAQTQKDKQNGQKTSQNAQKDRQNNGNKKERREERPRFDDVSEAKTKREREKLRPKKTVVEDVKDIYVKINKNGLWGFAERANGKEAISPKFDDVFSFKEDVCCVEFDGKYGYIDRKGDFVIEPQYDIAASFSMGYACVYKGDNCGYINKEGTLVIPTIYDAGTAVKEDGCRVKKNGQWGEINFDENGTPTEVRWIV